MPNRYEREIEEILRNLESTDPKASLGQKFGERLRRKQELPCKTTLDEASQLPTSKQQTGSSLLRSSLPLLLVVTPTPIMGRLLLLEYLPL